MNVKKALGFVGLIIILLAILSVSLIFVGCNSDVLVTVHTDQFGDIAWNASKESFDSFIITLGKVENFRPIYYFDSDYSVRADVNVLTADKLKKADCKDVYIKWVICEHTSAQNMSNGVDATCSTEGKAPDYLCPTCGHVEIGESIPCIPHTYIEYKYRAASCTEDGQMAHKECTICHYLTDGQKQLNVDDIIIEKLPHIESDWIVDYDSTCTKIGNKHKECTICNFIIKNEVILAKDHDLILHSAKGATCTEIGWNEYDNCSRCSYTTYVEISAKGHNTLRHEGKHATCDSDGYESYDYCVNPGCVYSTKVVIPALGHDTINHEAQEATCLSIGWNKYETCSRCSYTTYQEIAAFGHEMIHHDAKKETCTEIGWEEYDGCTRCDYKIGYNEIQPHHTIVEVSARFPTCIDPGYNVYEKCTECDYSTLVIIAALGHDDGVWVTDIQPTCTDVGSEDRKCTRCQHILETREVNALGHDVIYHKAQDATCLEIGWYEYDTCSRCNYTTYVVIPALEHDLVYVDKKEPKCYEPGHNAFEYCNRCSYTTYEELTIDHSIIHHEGKSATCLDKGWYDYDTCSRVDCKYSTYVEIPAIGHDNGKWIVDYDPTCTEKGSKHKICTRCESPLEHAFIDSLGHEIVHHAAQNATCIDIGWYAYDTCSRCDYSTYEEIGALGHDDGVWATEIQPTCIENGREARKCVRCQYVLETREVNALGHDTIHHTAQDATCLEVGWYAYDTCSRCDYSTYEEISAMGHNDGVWVTKIQPTCTRNGSEVRKCTRCQYIIETRKIDALGHDTIHHAAQDATCLEVGWYEYDTCSRCNYSTYEEIDALGHSYVDCICTRCSLENHINSGELCRHDKYIYFGTYPQSEVKDSSLIAVLTSQAGVLPTENNSANWTSYGYYIEGKISNYMWYIDISYSSETYRGVYFTSYRPEKTNYSSSSDYSYQDDNGYLVSTVYWFRYEPIKWRVLSESNGEALVLSEMIIDSRDYYDNDKDRTIDGATVYANNYAYSNIRAFLNNTFYNVAFSSLQKELILLTDIDNSARSSYEIEPGFENDSECVNSYACNNTSDHVFFLSTFEVSNPDYGFGGEEDIDLIRAATDYAQCQGAHITENDEEYFSGWWWLRSPANYKYDGARGVNYCGSRSYCYYLYSADVGVVPALRIHLTDCIENGHEPNEKCICTKCGDTVHDLIRHEAKGATCLDVGWYEYDTCSRCNYSTYQEIAALGHDYVDCICARCSLETHINDGKFCRHDDYIYFGLYPQSEVTDENLTSVLTAQAGALPTENNPANWTSYGYYIENEITDFMWYIDLTYGCETYRGVYFTSYRPSYHSVSSIETNSYQDENGYSLSTVYWFKYEPVKWRILNENNGVALILCELIIDSQAFYDNLSGRTIDGSTVYANNYAYSSIRTFLNDTFYNTSFTALQKELILLTEVDNTARGTNLDTNSSYWNSGKNTYACGNTNDYLFLLSSREMTTKANGFIATTGVSTTRQKKMTDYALSQGLAVSTESSYIGCANWLIRSPDFDSGAKIRFVQYSGHDYYNDLAATDYTACGIVPALRIKLSDSFGIEHTTNSNCVCAACGTVLHCLIYHSAKAATCTEIGWNEYMTCTRCSYTTYKEIPALDHDYIIHAAVSPTCTEIGWKEFATCSRCNYSTYQELSPLGGKHLYELGICSKCGVNAYTRDGDYIYFGTYPQSEVTDTTLTTFLTSSAGSLPTASNSANWTSYKYYISTNVKDYMWYIDLNHNGDQYRGVYFTSYRPYWTMGTSSLANSYQDDNGYSISTVYWFKYEPIKWRILSESDGIALMLCEMIIDSQEYYHTTSNRTIDGSTIYANNYAYSNIRTFLNENFYNTAFSSLQKELILFTKIDNSERSTNPDNNPSEWNGGTNKYACSNTNDHIFLLSEQEVTTEAYGFSADYSAADIQRQKKTTAYARCQGALTNASSGYEQNGWWWLRFPYYDSNYNARRTNYYGYAGIGSNVHDNSNGIVPALRIRLSDCIDNGHTLDSNCVCTKCGDTVHTLTYHSAQAVSCTEIGWNEYETCSRCNYSTYQEIPALDHDCITHEALAVTCTEIGWNEYQTCTRCDYSTYLEIPALGGEHLYEQGTCSKCGVKVYTRDGDYIYFGTYPQSEVIDTEFVSILTSQSGSLPTAGNSANWTSYKYYISSSVKDFMWYIDLKYEGEYYRGVYFTSYRPTQTSKSSSTGNSFQDDNGYKISTIYWFKHEPIQWRILSESNGEALILCEMVIDSQEYYISTSNRTINGSTVYSNNYAHSSIRAFLNDTFYNTAFSSLQKELILLTEVDNSVRSTNPDSNATQWNSGTNKNACSNTNDYVFLLSEQEVTTPAYGFSADHSNADSVRQKIPTNYAKIQGVSVSTASGTQGNVYWWLRSPYYANNTDILGISIDGNTYGDYYVNYINLGTVPALRIKLE